ncbi:hypothetical protein FHT08_000054 [Xanthomonas campestris]|uniref:hypothetical protein n=1 Tax=Xanthomonas sp. CFBP 8151 TaxID=3035310 RepID=UPI00141AE712|nr:hypothetical protein [Xanthomonas sp. CFBP 8151]MEB1610316.1 hypothetical protein [Xanthomonas campestris pv. campestris]NIJ75006.1 hypothetical protein [Xanthomonas sp. CFBP 8151]
MNHSSCDGGRACFVIALSTDIRGDSLKVDDGYGAKGGRERFIPIDTPARVADVACARQIAVARHRRGHASTTKLKHQRRNISGFAWPGTA